MAVPALSAYVPPVIVAANRRRSRRIRVSVPAVVWSAPDVGVRPHNERDTFHVAAIESLSSTGANLTCFGYFEEDDLMWIRFSIGSKVCQMKGVVRHSTLLCGSARLRTRCGIEFVHCHQTQHASGILLECLPR